MLTAMSVSTSTATSEEPYIAATASPYSFLVRNVDGYVAICDAADAEPLEFLDVKVNSLTDTEQAILDTGLYISSFTDIIEIVEAYTS